MRVRMGRLMPPARLNVWAMLFGGSALCPVTGEAAPVSPAQPEVVDGLLDGLEELGEVVAGAAKCHAHGALAVLADTRVLGDEVDVGRGAQLEVHVRRVPAHADLI